jgi:hypothetical protein
VNSNAKPFEFDLTHDNGEIPTPTEIGRLQEIIKTALNGYEIPIIPAEFVKNSPWSNNLKAPYSDYLLGNEDLERSARGGMDKALMTIGSAEFYDRPAEKDTVHEDNYKRWGALAFLFLGPQDPSSIYRT